MLNQAPHKGLASSGRGGDRQHLGAGALARTRHARRPDLLVDHVQLVDDQQRGRVPMQCRLIAWQRAQHSAIARAGQAILVRHHAGRHLRRRLHHAATYVEDDRGRRLGGADDQHLRRILARMQKEEQGDRSHRRRLRVATRQARQQRAHLRIGEGDADDPALIAVQAHGEASAMPTRHHDEGLDPRDDLLREP